MRQAPPDPLRHHGRSIFPQEVFDSKSDYTQRSTTRGDPVPLIPASRLVPLTGIIPANYHVPKPADYNWNYNEMRSALLAATVVSLSNIRKLPLTCRWTSSPHATKALRPRGSITSPPPTAVRWSPLDSYCLQSSSAQGKNENDDAQWDVNRFGCFGCDAFAGVSGSLFSPYLTLLVFLLSFSSPPLSLLISLPVCVKLTIQLLALLAVAAMRKLKGGLQGGLQKKTIEVGHLMDHAKSFVARRFLYEDFRRFFGRVENQRKGGWDTGNNHAMWKMDRLDLRADKMEPEMYSDFQQEVSLLLCFASQLRHSAPMIWISLLLSTIHPLPSRR
jgi:hypothetical protein